MGLDYDETILLAAAHDLTDPRKGMHLLLGALKRIGVQRFGLAVFGSGLLSDIPSNVKLLHIGPLTDRNRIALAYNAADLYVHPATEDNLPNMVMEAMACGTPSIGFPVGGVSEMIRLGVTGWLAESVSEDSLASTIRQALEEVEQDSLRSSCRSIAVAEYSAELQAQRYRELFQSLTSNLATRSLAQTEG